MKHRFLGIMATASAAMLALSACGAAESAEGTGESDELTSLSVVVAPIHFEPAYIAKREGYFEEAGLDVEIIPGADPTSNIARAVSGEVDITTGSWGTIITSNAQGVPIKAISGNGFTSPERPTSGILVLDDSPIQSPADLEGASVAIQGLNTGSEVPMFLAAEDHGADPHLIDRVEIASSGMETALLEGTVDSVLASSPFYEKILAMDNTRLISNPSTEYGAGNPVTVWSATQTWIDENADVAKAFNEAMARAEEFYGDPENLDAVLDITAEISEVDREALDEESLIPVSVAIDVEKAEQQVKDFYRFGIVEKQNDIDELLWTEAPRL